MDKCKEILEQLNREIRRIRKADLKAGKEKTVMIPMRDGVKLFTRFIFPEGNKRNCNLSKVLLCFSNTNF